MADVPEYDHIIIGAGPAGCVLANRLSADPGTTVLLLEAGGADTDPRIADPELWARLQGTDLDWDLRSDPQPGLGDRVVACPRGRVLGGSSAMNAMVWLRGDPDDAAAWRLGPEWTPAGMRALYERAETVDGSGTGVGPVIPPDPHPWSNALLDAARALGHPHVADFNRDGPRGVGRYAVTRDGGARRGAVAAYLRPAAGRSNLTVLTESPVRALRIADGNVVAVEYADRAGGTRLARPRAEVLLAAGVIGSPQLLVRSGVGPAPVLREHGVDVRVDLPGVGANLHDHIAVPVPFSAAEPDPRASRSGLGHVGLFTGGPPASLHVWLGPSTDPGGTEFTMAAGLTRPVSRGALRWAPGLEPIPSPGYLDAEADLDALVAAVDLIRDLAETSSLRPLWMDKAPDVFGATRAEVVDYVRAHAGTQFHLVGTCRMGDDDASVVDRDLRVRGLGNARVVDASVLPAITTGGPQAPTYAVAERAAELIRADAGGTVSP